MDPERVPGRRARRRGPDRGLPRGPRALPGAAADRARHDRAAAAGPRPRGAGADGRDPRGRRPPRLPQRHPLAAPGVLRLLRDHRVRPRDAGRVPDGRAGPEPDALADLADRDGARGRRRALAARGAGPARRVRRPADRHRVHLHADRPRRGARGGGPRRGREGPRRPRGPGAAPGLRLGRGAQLDREGVHDAGPGPGRARQDPDQRPVRDGRRGAGGGDRGGPRRRAAGPSRSSRRSARRRPRRSTRWPPSRTSRSARACGSTSTRAYAGVVALLPDRRAPFAGWERADSIVVNPHKWLFTPLDASLLLSRRMDQLRAAFSLVPEYLRTLDRVNPVLDYNEYQPQLGRRMRALKLWMQLRWFGLEGLRRRIAYHLDAGRARCRRGSTPTRTGSASPRPRSPRSASATGPRASPAARTSPRSRAAWTSSTRPDGRRQPHRRGLPLAHAPRATGSRSGSPSATCAPSRATSSGPGSCCDGRPPAWTPQETTR